MEVMRKLAFLVMVGLLVSACDKMSKKDRDQIGNQVVPAPKPSCAEKVISNEFIVMWKDGRTSFVKGKTRDEVIDEIIIPNLEDIKLVDYNQEISIDLPDMGYKTSDFFGDKNWGVQQIQAEAAWSVGVKGQGVIVAVIDSGLDTEHPLIKNQLALNLGEIPNNNFDDDNNGLVDDYKGYNFKTRSGAITDPNGHGTHVAGTIVSEHSADETQPMGVAPAAKVLGLGFMDEGGAGSTAAAIEAIDYAVSRGAKVINASWGGVHCDSALKERIANLNQEGVLFVTAAGNDGLSLDSHNSYPAKFILDGSITVGASTPSHYNAHFSNYSENYVHLVAPGVDIYQTIPNNSYRYLGGTSMAAPHVSGAAALILSANPSLTPLEVKNILLQSVTPNFYPVSSHGELNVASALQLL